MPESFVCLDLSTEDQEHFLLHCCEESMAKKRAEIRDEIAVTLAKLKWDEHASAAAIADMKQTLDTMPVKEQLRLFLADAGALNNDGEELVDSNIRTLNVLIPVVTNAVWDLYQTRCAVIKAREDRERRERAAPVLRQSRLTDFVPAPAAATPPAPKQSALPRPAFPALPKLSQQQLRLTSLPRPTPSSSVVCVDDDVLVAASSADAPARASGRARPAPPSSSPMSMSVLSSGTTYYYNSRNPSPEGHDDTG